MWRVILVVTLLAAILPTASIANADMVDYDIANGRFFSQTAPGPTGYSVTDDGAPFWSTFRQYGGVETVGYPISRRFVWDGQPAQAFQKGVMHWRPDLKQVVFVNIFDQLTRYGKDPWLRDVRLVPPPRALPNESAMDFATVVRNRLALLDAYPDIRARYYAATDPMTFFGLPMAPPEDFGTVVVVRLQRAVIQQWKTPRPWANAGEVTIANGGDVGKEAGLFPTAALEPEPPGGAGNAIVVGVAPAMAAASASPPITPFAGPSNATPAPRTATTASLSPTPRPSGGAAPMLSPVPSSPTRTVTASSSATTAAIPTRAAGGVTATATLPPPYTLPISGPTPPPGAIVVVLDPGHGGYEIGAAATFSDGVVLREKDLNLAVARRVADGLRAAGFWVVMTRQTDQQVNVERRNLTGKPNAVLQDDLQARVDIANAAGAQLFVSIHHNGSPDPTINGVEVYSCRSMPTAAANQRFGKLLEESLLTHVRAAGYDLQSRGQKDCYDIATDSSYFVIGPAGDGHPRALQMPGVISEPMFLTNPSEAWQLRDDRILTAQARGYVEAIKRFFGKT